MEEQQNTDIPDWFPWVYIKPEWGSLSDDGLGILLTANFNKHHLKIHGGQIWFGLLGGELKLGPINAKIPYKHRWPETPIVFKTKIKRKAGKASSSKETQGSSGELKAAVKLAESNVTGGISQTRGHEQEYEKSLEEEFEYAHVHISTKGSEKEAIWEFEASKGSSYLQGNLIEQEIGKLIIHTNPYAVDVEFRAFEKDIRPLSAEGFWRPEDLGSQKRIRQLKEFVLLALLRRKIAKMNLIIYSFRLEQPTQ